MPKWIEVRRTTFGVAYVVVGGPENGRPLSLADYCRYVDAGVPIVRR